MQGNKRGCINQTVKGEKVMMVMVFIGVLLFLLGMVCGAVVLTLLAFHFSKEETNNGGKKEE